MRALKTSCVAVAFAAALALAAALPCAAATTLTVDSNADDGSAGTLRYELNNAADGDTIDITATGTIFLTSGELSVYKSVTITGPGQELLTVDGKQAGRVFYIAPENTVTISGLTIANGKFGSGSGKPGGGIWNGGELTLSECTLTNNEGALGGAVFNQGTLTLKDCTLSNNTAVGRYDGDDPDFNYYGSGGAIFVVSDNEVSLTLDSCTLSGNSASGEAARGGGLGGAIAIGVVVEHFEDQTGANVIIRNSTLTGNFAVGYGSGSGGAISNVQGSLTIDNSTLAGNYDDWEGPEEFHLSGAIINLLGSLKIKNTILANDESATNLLSFSITGDRLPIDDLGFNLCTDDCSELLDSAASLLNTDPMLGPLADNGGPTQTHALLAGSPAIDAAAATDSAGNPVEFDQRGVARPQGSANDIGAVEFEQATVNGPPTADPGGPYLAAVNAAFAVDGSASWDPEGDSLTYSWELNNATQTGASPSFVAPAEPGIYTLVLTVNDGQGGGDRASTSVVVYDASAGFVTGGGWIDSPAGAYFADPDLAGKATFGFVSKYRKGATVPTGNTAFEFTAGDLQLESTSYEWLLVTGSDYARFKGSGTINGIGDYRFMVWAGDNEPDTFSIRIWQEDEATGVETEIYDNGFDQPIGGGSIVIHTK